MVFQIHLKNAIDIEINSVFGLILVWFYGLSQVLKVLETNTTALQGTTFG